MQLRWCVSRVGLVSIVACDAAVARRAQSRRRRRRITCDGSICKRQPNQPTSNCGLLTELEPYRATGTRPLRRSGFGSGSDRCVGAVARDFDRVFGQRSIRIQIGRLIVSSVDRLDRDRRQDQPRTEYSHYPKPLGDAHERVPGDCVDLVTCETPKQRAQFSGCGRDGRWSLVGVAMATNPPRVQHNSQVVDVGRVWRAPPLVGERAQTVARHLFELHLVHVELA